MKSANQGLRTRHKQATAHRLTALCRILAAERGINGFTIEELCSEVGVSRRTFFNYFSAKEDAVFGIDEVEARRHFVDEFLARGSRGWGAAIGDLVELSIDFSLSTGVGAAEHAQFLQAVEREPRLLARFVGIGREREARLIDLVTRREGVAPGDPRPRAVVELVTAAMRSVSERLSEPAVVENFGGVLYETLAAMREVLESPIPVTPRKERS